MATSIVIPPLGESITEGIVQTWRKPDGAYVARDEVVMDLETDKITMEIPASASGTLKHKAAAGDTVRVGATVGEIDESAAAPAASTVSSPAPQPSGTGVPPVTPASSSAAAPSSSAPSAPAPSPSGRGQGEGSGSSPALSTAASASSPPQGAPRTPHTAAQATPLAKKMADEAGIDVNTLTGTGPAGRVREQDVLAAIQARASGSTSSPQAPSLKPQAHSRAVTRERMSALRQRIAVRLVEAQHTAAMLTTFNECDMTKVMALRNAHKDAFEKTHGVKLGFMSFFVKAACSALQKFPNVNASIVNGEKGPEVEHHHYCDIAVAVGTDKGLVVPVLRNCESLDFAGIERGIGDLAVKARDNKLTLDDMQGGTFTISNGGVYGSMMSTPILNPPQSGILGMHNIIRRPVENPEKPGSGEVVVRPMMYLALSYDHRIVDGAGAVGFLKHIKECIEDPTRLLLSV